MGESSAKQKMSEQQVQVEGQGGGRVSGDSTREERDQLGDEIIVFSSKIDAAIGELLGLIRAFDASGAWLEQGAVSCAQWLSWKTGVGRGAARERVRVARALGELPVMEAGLCSGELSWSISSSKAFRGFASGSSADIGTSDDVIHIS